jgi:hypothetical protein
MTFQAYFTLRDIETVGIKLDATAPSSQKRNITYNKVINYSNLEYFVCIHIFYYLMNHLKFADDSHAE